LNEIAMYLNQKIHLKELFLEKRKEHLKWKLFFELCIKTIHFEFITMNCVRFIDKILFLWSIFYWNL